MSGWMAALSVRLYISTAPCAPWTSAAFPVRVPPAARHSLSYPGSAAQLWVCGTASAARLWVCGTASAAYFWVCGTASAAICLLGALCPTQHGTERAPIAWGHALRQAPSARETCGLPDDWQWQVGTPAQSPEDNLVLYAAATLPESGPRIPHQPAGTRPAVH